MATKEKKQNEEKPKPTHVAAVTFRDAEDFNKLYQEGEDVSHLNAEHLENLVKLGHVSKIE